MFFFLQKLNGVGGQFIYFAKRNVDCILNN